MIQREKGSLGYMTQHLFVFFQYYYFKFTLGQSPLLYVQNLSTS
jgi:hypothetical protein